MKRLPGVVLALLAGVAQAQAPSPLPRAVEAYEQLEFERCVELLTSEATAQAALYRGLCRFNLAQPAEAREEFRRALSTDRGVTLPSGVSPKAAELFRSAQGEVAAVEPKAPPTAPPPVANSVTKTSGLRFGVGPLLLGGAAVVAAGVAGYFGIQAKRNEGLANGERFTFQADRYAGWASSSATASNVSWTVAGAALLSAAVWWALQQFMPHGEIGSELSSQTLPSHWFPGRPVSKLETGP